MTDSNQPFDDIRALFNAMPDADAAQRDAVISRANGLGRELAPLGDLTHRLATIAAWQGAPQPQVLRPLIAVFAGTHGVAGHVFDGDLPSIAKTRIASLTEASCAVRGIAASCGAAFKVYEFGLDYPSEDFTKAPSLSERDCAAAIAFGMEVVAEGADIIVLGNAGLGAATAAAGIARGLYGGAAEYWAGGTGPAAKARIDAVKTGANLHKALLSDPLNVLRVFGGRDLAGILGAIIAARHQRIPVILDGYVVCAAAAVMHQINPNSLDHCLAGQVSAEPAHQALLDRIGIKPVLDLSMNIGDGTGGALALSLLQAASAGLATLSEG